MESNFCFVYFSSFLFFYIDLIYFIFICFSNHLYGQDTLHVDVYDKDLIKNDKIGSLVINLKDLYEQSMCY